MMKILLVLPRFDRRKFDALTSQAWQIARRLTASGQAQCIIAAGRSEDEAALEVIENVPIHRFLPAPYRWKFWQNIFRREHGANDDILPGLEVFLRKKHFDLVHLMCGGRLCEYSAKILQECQTKYVISCLPARGDGGTDMTGGSVHLNMETLTNAQRIFCRDHRQRRKLAAKLGDRQLVYWMPGVEFDRFSRPQAVDFRQFYKISPQRTVILSVGRISRSRNQKILLEMLSVLNSRNRNCQLVIIGWSEDDAYKAEFLKMAAERKLSNAVTCIEGLPPGDERFPAAFQAASLVMLPALDEASATAVLEAWTAGVPVVTSPMGSGGELIEDKVNGRIANPRNFQAWVKCCEELLDERNRSALEKMRSNGMIKARSLQWPKRIEDLLKIYEESIL